MSHSFNRFIKDHRVARSRHTGEWIIEQVNSAYGYWATVRRHVPEEAATFLLQMPEYKGEEYEAERVYRSNMHLCG